MASDTDLYRAIEAHQCVLFLGAGVHYPPNDIKGHSYPVGDRPPLGAQLSIDLARECREEIADLTSEERRFLAIHKRNLQRISWFYEMRRGRKALIDRIVRAVGDEEFLAAEGLVALPAGSVGRKPSAVVRALAKIGFPLIITTNYDRLFEMALAAHHRTAVPSVYCKEKTKETPTYSGVGEIDRPWVFKMHGCISQRESIVVTDEDYIRFVMRMNDPDIFHPVPERFRSLFSKWTTLFVGYSLMDYNLRLLFRTLRWGVDESIFPSTFSIDRRPDPLIVDTYQNRARYVTFIVRDIWHFVPDLYARIFDKPMPP